MVVESPQSFIVAEDCRKAAWQNGYRRDLGQENGWARFASTTAKGTICLAAEGGAGPWFLALDHAGVAAELGLPTTNIACPGLARYVFVRLPDLYDALQRVYALGVSLPDGPLATFGERTRSLPRSTEAERLVVQRIGQDIFRDSLLAYWNGRCPLTGIADPALLRASHIKPWRACDSDAERLDVHNGLLLSALWDAAFDGGLVTFEDDGTPRYSQTLCREARPMLLCRAPLSLTDRHRSYLAWHRTCSFASKPVAAAPMQAP